MIPSYTKIFTQLLHHYGFQSIPLQADKRRIFNEASIKINKKIESVEILKLTKMIFHLDGGRLEDKRSDFEKTLNSRMISSYNKKDIFIFDNQLDRNQLHYYIEENVSLGQSFIALYFNGINLVNIHINENGPLETAHKQYLQQLNLNPSLYEQNLFNVLYAEDQLYFGRLVTDLDLFKLVTPQPFHAGMPDYLEKVLDQGSHHVTINLEQNEKLLSVFSQLNLIISQVWSLLMMTPVFKTK